MKILLFLGGTYHDFEGFRAAMTPVLEEAGAAVEASYDADRLLALESSRADVVLQYTCFGTADKSGKTVAPLTEAQGEALRRWVRSGGGLLSAHAATVFDKTAHDLSELHGGRFLEHPPRFAFTVTPLSRRHPVTAGIEAFAVFDELYMQDVRPDADVHMVALDRGIAHPMVWTRTEERGRVAHVAPGHDERVWGLEPYRRLIKQGLQWVANGAD